MFRFAFEGHVCCQYVFLPFPPPGCLLQYDFNKWEADKLKSATSKSHQKVTSHKLHQYSALPVPPLHLSPSANPPPNMHPSSPVPRLITTPHHSQTSELSVAALFAFFFFLITFSEQKEPEGTGTLIHGCDRGAISQRERWSACSLVPAHTHSLKVRSNSHLIFSQTNNLEEMAFEDTKVPWR